MSPRTPPVAGPAEELAAMAAAAAAVTVHSPPPPSAEPTPPPSAERTPEQRAELTPKQPAELTPKQPAELTPEQPAEVAPERPERVPLEVPVLSPDQGPDRTPDHTPSLPPPLPAQSPTPAHPRPPDGTMLPHGAPAGSPAAPLARELATEKARLDDLATNWVCTASSLTGASRHRKMSSLVSKAAMDTLSKTNHSPRSFPGRACSVTGRTWSHPAEPPVDPCSAAAPGSSATLPQVRQVSMSMLSRRRHSQQSGGTEAVDPCSAAWQPGSAGPAKPAPLHEHKEFPIVVMCAVFLATVAGWVNAVTIISFREGVTHVSGSSTMLGEKAVQAKWLELAEFAVLVFSFFLGAGASGIAVGNTKFVLGQKYGTVLVVIGILLAAGVAALGIWPRCSLSGEAECEDKHYCTWDAAAGLCDDGLWPQFLVLTLWALAMGCQNGMGTTVSGAVVRTTHVTGVVTDLGLTVGQWLRHKWLRRGGSPDLWKLRLHGPILAAFVTGGVLGAVADDLLDDQAVLPPAVLYVIGGLVYNLGRRYGVFNLYLEENFIQEKVEAVEGAFAKALATVIEEANADPEVDDIDDDVVGMDADVEELMSPVIHPHKLSFRRQPHLPVAPTTPTAL
eukprot:TRINITY_DN238_c0_g1_i2.p1 TRINITY_DN238_c0_g1~~TRINITY_DN238_c0_g1_i2.p1  ORF type:complete len:619 (+),score=104.36 TRINITY_DN238_c0_g1_i2:100-1956(+)